MGSLSPEGELEQLTRDLQDAVLHQDRDRLESLVGLPFRLITSRSGNPVTRDEWISAATGPFHVASYELIAHDVIRDGDIAATVHRLRQDARLGEQRAASFSLTTDTWTRAAGRWQIIARHPEALLD